MVTGAELSHGTVNSEISLTEDFPPVRRCKRLRILLALRNINISEVILISNGSGGQFNQRVR